MNRESTLTNALVAAASTGRGLRAIEHDGQTSLLPYRILLTQALVGAGALAAAGLEPGDRVALVVPQVGDFIQALFAILAAGLVPVPLVPPVQAGDVPTFRRQSRQLLVASRASAVVTTVDVAPLLDLAALSPAPRLADHRRARGRPGAVRARCRSIPTRRPCCSSPRARRRRPRASCCRTPIWSPTSPPSPAPTALTSRPTDVGVSWLPLYHDMGLIGMLLTAVCSGSDAVIMSPVLFLKRPTAWLEAISKYRGTVSFAPNFAYELCLRRVKPSQIEALDLSSWRVAGCGAEPIRPDTLQAFADRFASAGFRASSFVPSYGLAEHSLAVSLARDGMMVDRVDAARLGRESVAVPALNGSPAVRIVGCGAAFPATTSRSWTTKAWPLPERHVGHIVARGPSVMAAISRIRPRPRKRCGTAGSHTGDLGYMATVSCSCAGGPKT